MTSDMVRGLTILLTISDNGNREQLISHLDRLSGYNFVTGENPSKSDQEIDLWILDGTALERDVAAVRSIKEANKPQYFPVLLLCPEARASSLESSIWNYVDDVISVPVTPTILNARIKNLLRTRAISIQSASSRQRFDSLVRTTSSAILFLAMDGTIEFANSATETLFGYENDELIGSPITQLIPDRLQAAAEEGIQNYENKISQGVTGATLESIGQHKNGHEIPIRLSYGWFELDEETYLTGIVHEISDIKKRETRLQVLNRVLRHDIRNDMNLILGHAQLLKDGAAKPDSHIDTILSVVDDVIKLSEQARELDQLFESEQNARKSVDICSLIEAKSVEFREAYPGTTIDTAFPDGKELYAEAINLIESVIDNLIENAIEHNDTDTPELTITLSQVMEDEMVSIKIVDNGPGLSQADIDVIETGTETALEHASGLGLWLVNWIVTESGGYVHFSENDPRGSCIQILLHAA
ncbi:PAS domain S-box protein [Natrinema sp. 1APR25-10V2]|uniref:PAS domain S-box protein n=1 Tax=Natrinema sp. 1APR25-10V2 TaxID=2951081 RepID=UPI002874E898|nr:PAS domain S-box protein [Natrinema sp. 1APR25-10V2]MDS0477106.1 PAS domain S-box protein [Natrinema sp. 1APR25-10V2]